MVDGWWKNLIVIALLVGVSVLVAWLLMSIWRLVIMLWKQLTVGVSTCLKIFSPMFSVIGIALFLVQRGRLTVRASTYLIALSHPEATPASANKLASSIDTYAAKQLFPGVLNHLNEVFNGSRLALISEARLQGFSE